MSQDPMPAEGDPAPDFTLPDQDGEDVMLPGLRGRPVVLYFYPRPTRGVAEGVTRAMTER